MKDLTKLSDKELKDMLTNLKEELQDVEMERGFMTKQSGVHVSSSKISSQMEEFDTEIEKLKNQIKDCEDAMCK
ncbi:hypothetical protein Q5O24_13140 [Eubacteriaceae bacterium ES3]|nr:hypothetical protein Q5O24_13140 [Eubacteriaceae bacterium ES3]